ncbi:hypothetical protein TNCT_690041 [Trichonephila clavata]|uniref:Uncharacterized protein n=1 Tax=Trichonephila clavata TaxID=2740835 RepID=A0A8X6HL32_TRICU|nr:hypothetical protein TNCT_690041 [Trichonephila clavata]
MFIRIEEETKDKMMQKGAGKDLCTKPNERRQRLGKRRQMSSPKEVKEEPNRKNRMEARRNTNKKRKKMFFSN